MRAFKQVNAMVLARASAPDRGSATNCQPGLHMGRAQATLPCNKSEIEMELDHLAVAATTLDEAADAIETALGVSMQPGGQHQMFGTHNRLLGLEGGVYLEAIAIDPSAADPGRGRWFDLDAFEGPARLSNWICRTPDIGAALGALPEGLGSPVQLSRGDLRWRMAVPESGRLPYDNIFPALIQWQGSLHPGSMLAPSGCFLQRLVVAHPDAHALRAAVPLHDDRVVFEVGTVALMAEFGTPHGMRVLQ
jgi:hypothetical protein